MSASLRQSSAAADRIDGGTLHSTSVRGKSKHSASTRLPSGSVSLRLDLQARPRRHTSGNSLLRSAPWSAARGLPAPTVHSGQHNVVDAEVLVQRRGYLGAARQVNVAIPNIRGDPWNAPSRCIRSPAADIPKGLPHASPSTGHLESENSSTPHRCYRSTLGNGQSR
jgi:hypothetical protein